MSFITTKSLTGRIVSTFHLVGSISIPLTVPTSIIKLQRHEYDALEEKLPNVYYFILG